MIDNTARDMMNWLFKPTFSRAEFYGFVLFVAALVSGANPILCLVAFVAWALFANAKTRVTEVKHIGEER